MQDNHHAALSHTTSQNTPSTHVRVPRPRLHLEDLFPPLSSPPHRRRFAIGMVVVAAVVGSFFLLREAGVIQRSADDGGGLSGISSQTRESETDTRRDNEDIPFTEQTEEGSNDSSPTDTNSAEKEPDAWVPDSDEGSAPSEFDTSSTPPSTKPEETEPPLPTGCIGFVSMDKSESAMGVEYIQSSDVLLPDTLPNDSPWSETKPTVLIIHSQPYEGYSGGAPWYDPTSGELALIHDPNDPDGVVALGVKLAAALREQGVAVIHVRLKAEAEESASSIYERTEEAVRYYHRLYPDIGLVIDLRRSAELTADGSILATQGNHGGESCAQLRITVNGGRDGQASTYDLAVAVELRRSLWDTEPTLCRPVRVKKGEGMIGDREDLRILTLEMGSAGNTFAEACALVEPLSSAICGVIEKYS